jgi:hypothetical protein
MQTIPDDFNEHFTQSQAEHVLDVEQAVADRDVARRMYNTKLNALRAQHPYLKISPFANKAVNVFLVANTPIDVNIPTGTKMIRFNSDAVFYVSRNGLAQLPANVNATTHAADGENGSFIPNPDTFYYVEEIHQLSVVSRFNANVTIECHAQV